MANPTDAEMFTVWRRAYEHFGVLPTYAWPEKAQLDPLLPGAAAVLEQARFFQKLEPQPEFDVPWRSNDLFVYRLKDGGRARFTRNQGVAFEAQRSGQASQVLERRIEGVSEARLEGSIPGWPAFDGEKVIGLNPSRAYAWSPKPRDLNAPHLSALPADLMLGRAGVQEGFARFQIVRSPAGESRNTITLWDYTGSVTGGVRLAGGAVRTFGGLEFEDEETAGAVHPDGNGLFIHPPWKKIKREGNGVRNATFLNYPLTLPDFPEVRFTSGIELKPGTEGKSDGVTFKAVATRGGEERRCTVHHATEKAGLLELDLSDWRGKSILLHLEADPGPAGAPDYDWARFVGPRIAVSEGNSPALQTVSLAGVARPQELIVAEGKVELTAPAPMPGKRAEIQVRCRFPNTLIVPIMPPAEAVLPVNLLQAQFTSHLLFDDGLERPSYSYFGGSVMEAKCNGRNRQALSLHPPPAGRSLVDWWLRLPAAPARLVTAIGIRDGAKPRGVGFTIEVNGRKVFERNLQPETGWVPVEVSLAEWKGQPVVLTFLTDSFKEGQFAWAVWAEPRLVLER